MTTKANNHFAPQFYLKNFSHDPNKNKIFTCQLLVEHEKVPTWQPLSIKKRVAQKRHLYTRVKEEKESDEKTIEDIQPMIRDLNKRLLATEEIDDVQFFLDINQSN